MTLSDIGSPGFECYSLTWDMLTFRHIVHTCIKSCWYWRL